VSGRWSPVALSAAQLKTREYLSRVRRTFELSRQRLASTRKVPCLSFSLWALSGTDPFLFLSELYLEPFDESGTE
jgi:hypothetical protein